MRRKICARRGDQLRFKGICGQRMISVIIPVYNRAHLVSRAIDSVLEQSYEDYEVVVVDDGSNDGTADVVRNRYGDTSRLRLLIRPGNRGVSAARNAGVADAKGSWLAFLDSDDEWKPRKLERQMAGLAASRLEVSHTNEIWIRNGVHINQHKHHRKYGGRIFLRALPLCIISPSSLLLSRSVFDEIGPFDESLPACEDYDLFLRLTCRHEVNFLDEKLVLKYGGHSDQLSRAHYAMDRFRVAALERTLIECSEYLSQAEYTATVDTLVQKARIVCDGAIRHDNGDLARQMLKYVERWDS